MNSATTQPWHGPFVWSKQSIASDDDWMIHLNSQEIDELHKAVVQTRKNNQTIASLTRGDFKFKYLSTKLLRLKDEILNGKGFTLIRGLPAAHWSDEELIRAYWGIGTWLGDAVSQNAKAHLLGHVIDQRAQQSGDTRIYQTNRAQPFHSDSCDIVGLLCLRTAKQGGESSVASSAAIHNALLDNEPESLKQLYKAFQCDRYGEIPEGKLPYYSVNVFNRIDNHLVCCAMDPDIRSAQRLENVAPLTRTQIKALDDFQKTARQQCLQMSLQRGDIQLVNNLVAVHAREAFVDHDDVESRRYLIRLWLSSSQGRRLPEFLRERWGNIAVGNVRGGIKVPNAKPVVNLDPNS